ncbi:DHA2 family efflux MFS transporter permease subunit [Sediminivirga luteola]|uniref:MFS transporter n=1 Tax=Sediminivirga luteola TaxID=1774748 RepID=A0A8J2TWA7_9MICO|nr:DHA2 family efflux MFS transporter permease subunit [Sediminivirga luteola]MCI2266560.1 DHA2 family efflux MFS transporter permease subunit [Sediminivirga luteola]GGA07883.1 MFS transporter [Sediminivirga luteola]
MRQNPSAPSSASSGISAEAPGGLSRTASQAIWLLLFAAFTVILNETIMSVAISELMEDLHVTAATAQWLSTAFMLTMAIVIPTTGFLLQRVTTRQMFISAMSVFSAGTLLCMVAPGFTVLLIGRIIQACGTAAMMPLLMTTVLQLVPFNQRGRMMGRISIVIAVAPAIGPTISGAILSLASWRWMFGVVLPVALFMLFLGWKNLKNVSETRDIPLDLLSVLLSALGFGGLVFGLSSIAEVHDAPMTLPLTGIIGGVMFLLVFGWRQLHLQRRDSALLDLRTFTHRNFALAAAVSTIAMGSLFGTVILLPLYLQRVLQIDPLTTGLLLLPGGLAMGLLGPVIGRIFDAIGPRPLVVPGAVALSIVMWLLTFVDAGTPVWMLLAGHIAMSVSLACMLTPMFGSGLGVLPPKLQSYGSATIGTVQQLAAAAGTAAFIAVMTIAQNNALASGADEAEALVSGLQAAFTVGACASLVAVVLTPFITRVREDSPAPASH